MYGKIRQMACGRRLHRRTGMDAMKDTDNAQEIRKPAYPTDFDAAEAPEISDAFGQVFGNAPDAMVVLDAGTLRIEDVNSAALDLYGYAKAALIGRSFADLTADTLERERIARAASRANADDDLLLDYRRGDGGVFTGETRIGTIVLNHQKKYLAGIRDINHRLDAVKQLKKAEKDLRISQELLHQAQKMEALGKLVSGVAHEINNPVNLLMYSMPVLKRVWNDFLPLFADIAAKQPDKTFGGLTYAYLDENLAQILSDAELAADRITNIVADLKNFAKQTNIEDTVPVKINQAVENALRLAQATIRKSGVALDVRLADDIPLMEGNPQNIEQIVLNLTINGIQAIDHDRGRIRISTDYDPDADQLLLTVSDNGRGIKPELMETLFDPFVTDKQAEGGTGLGLSVTYSLIRAHEGEIGFETSLGEGTRFTIRFPSKLKPRQVKILVVDDHELVRDVLVRALKRDPFFVVEEASDGINACIKLGSFKPHLLILDIFMPEMNGLEVCRVIRSDADLADLKVIVTTGHPGHRMLDEVAELGFDNFLIKPVEIKDFLEAVDRALGR